MGNNKNNIEKTNGTSNNKSNGSVNIEIGRAHV